MNPSLKLFLHLNRVLRRLLKPDGPFQAAGSALDKRELYLWFALTAFEEWRSINQSKGLNPTAEFTGHFLLVCEAFRQEAEARIALGLRSKPGNSPKAMLQ